jgi:hypothetical protein
LHIQVCPQQRDEKNRNYDHQQPTDGSPEAEHSKNLTQRVNAAKH